MISIDNGGSSKTFSCGSAYRNWLVLRFQCPINCTVSPYRKYTHMHTHMHTHTHACTHTYTNTPTHTNTHTTCILSSTKSLTKRKEKTNIHTIIYDDDNSKYMYIYSFYSHLTLCYCLAQIQSDCKRHCLQSHTDHEDWKGDVHFH